MHRDEYDAALRRGIELGLEAAASATWRTSLMRARKFATYRKACWTR
jgi:hypothetical protein